VSGVFEGFATIVVVILLGFLLAHFGVLDEAAQVMLSRLAFFVASPALLVTVIGDTDVTEVLSTNLAATTVGVAGTAAVYLALARGVWRRGGAETVIGTLCAVYVNAGNLGLPVAAYVLGDVALVAPVLVLQLLFLQPLALAMLDALVVHRALSWGSLVLRALGNPLLVGSLAGLVLSVTDATLPGAVRDPLELVGGMAVPAMLIAYGISLRVGPLPGRGASTAELTTIAALKLLVQPLVVYVAARLLGVEGHALLAVTVLAALPTAQNIFVHATRYGTAAVLARDAIFVTTLLSIPTIIVIVALLA
jgi:predicted permease